ncbi:hypothetical protein [Paenibacillus sp. MMS20-IR301]|uniref:hypothetical protein n=1 Tax=Paenibacillus sp. MMS20-IR301 TaxID=2895946 RepID=UPI0028EF0292|nr:hypothetical protein [Paenibacillus sp. MMS20-IR301]WNS45564.1 hypothetical protein LOS79_09930 [Paenibacillus sp. MMS20-IR301]
MNRLFLLTLIISFITGCSNESSTSYPSAVAMNNIVYGLSSTIVEDQDVGEEIGRIGQISSPMPVNNGDSNDVPVGSSLHKIIGEDTDESIAVKVNGKYYRASKSGPLSGK